MLVSIPVFQLDPKLWKSTVTARMIFSSDTGMLWAEVYENGVMGFLTLKVTMMTFLKALSIPVWQQGKVMWSRNIYANLTYD